MKRSAVSNSAPRRRGMVVALVAVSMVTLLLFGSLAVDVGYICALTAEAQDNADAGCLAGVSAIHDGDYGSVRARALDMIGRNQKRQGFLALEDQIIEVGRWDKATATFESMDFSLASKANAVRVVAKRNKVSLFFAALIGHTSTDVSREAIAQVAPTCGGVWGLDEVKVPGNVVVDSYFSTEGDYSAGSANDNGDVCSNGPMNVSGSIEIHGDVIGDPVEVAGGKAIITGYIDELDKPVEVPPVDFGDVATNNDNATIGLTDQGRDPFPSGGKYLGGWNLVIRANDNLTLAPGTYYFDSAVLGSKMLTGSITLTGPTTIYVAGDFGAAGKAQLNTTRNPHNLTIYSSGSKFKLAGKAAVYGSIFAPNTDVMLVGNAEMYGALIGKTVKMAGNFNFHVDESLPLVHSLKRAPFLVK